MLIGTLKPTPPYNFDITLDAVARLPPVMDIVRGVELWRALHVAEQIALVRVCSRGTAHDPLLDVHLVAASGVVDTEVILAQLRHLLGTDEDLGAFYAFVRMDAALWETVEPLQGLRFIRAASMFEGLTVTIIEQQIALTTAQRAERWLVEWAGNCIVHDGAAYYAFPRPSQLAAAQVADLIPLKITFRRMQLLIDLAQQTASGQFDPETLRVMTPRAAFDTLIRLHGIGQWTAAWTLTRGLSGHYAVGYNDVALQAAVNRYFYGQPGRAASEVVSNTFERYGEYANLAAFYTLMRWVFDRYEPADASFNTTGPSVPPPE
jgi:3-methyladenine DNA glycosylase/8-oxoguanine DNA glycosylase